MAKLNFSIALGLAANGFKSGLNNVQSSLKSFASSIKSTMGLIAGAFAAGQIKAFSQECLNAYSAQIQAEQKLSVIMKQRMSASDAEIKSILKLTSAQQKQGVIGDEVQLAGAQQVATFLKQKSSLEALIPAMNNLLAQQKGLNATQGDAVNIGNLMGKVMTGQTSALKRVGISFDAAQEKILKYGTESQKAATLAKVITQNVGNMNSALAQTDMGKIQQMNNTLGDLKEQIGGAIAPIVAELAPSITDFAVKGANALSSFIKTVKDNFSTIAQQIMIALAAIKLTPMIQGWVASFKAAGNAITASARATAATREVIESNITKTIQALRQQETLAAKLEGDKKVIAEQKVKALREKLQTQLKQRNIAAEKAMEAQAKASAYNTSNVWSKAATVMGASMKAACTAMKSALVSIGIGAVIVIIGELIAKVYELVSAENAAKQSARGMAEAQNDVKEAHRGVQESVGTVVEKYKVLQGQWNKLKNSAEQNKWLRENKTNFEELGLAIKNSADAQKVFVTYSKKVVTALKAMAIAQGLNKALEQAVEKKATEFTARRKSKATGDYYTIYHKGDNITDAEAQAAGVRTNSERTTSVDMDSNRTISDLTADEIDRVNKYRAAQARKLNKSIESSYDYTIDAILNEYIKAQKEADTAQKAAGGLVTEVHSSMTNVTGTGKKKHKTKQTPAEQAAENVANAEHQYAQTIEKAKQRKEDGLDTQAQYENKVYSALQSLYDAYGDAQAKAPNEKYKKALSDTAEKIKAQGKVVTDAEAAEEKAKKTKEEEEEAAKKLADAEKKYAKDMAEIAKQQAKGRDTTFDFEKTDSEKVQAQLEFDLDIAQQQLDALKEKAGDDCANAIEQIKAAEDKVEGLDKKLKLSQVEEKVKQLQKSLSQETWQAVQTSWQGIEGIVSNISSLVDTMSDPDASGWEKFCSVIDTAMSLVQTFSGIIEAFNTISTLTSQLGNANAVAKGLEATQTEIAAVAETEHTTVLTAEAVATTAAAKAAEKLAAAEIFAAHASIPFSGEGIAAGYVAAMEAVMATVGAFSTGGIVGGSSPHGDFVNIRANSGEAILTQAQQARFMRIANGQSVHNGNCGSANSIVRGEQLVSVINAYAKRTGRGEILK